MEALVNPTEELLMAKEMKQHTEKIIARLPKQQQLIFRLSREEGLSHNEIARKLGLSSHTVKNHMVQALKTLRTSLQQTGHNPFIVLILYWVFVR